MSVRVRYAPSPTGSPHVGNVRTALYCHLFARRHGGTHILRIEDTDRARFVPGCEEEIIESIQWLGIEWQEGPDKGGAHAPYRQSERSEAGIYRQHVERLIELGHAYPAFDTPEELEEMRLSQQLNRQPIGYFGGLWREAGPDQVAAAKKEGRPYVIRLRMPRDKTLVCHDAIRGRIEFDSNTVDDPVLVKADGMPTYHCAAMIDDHLMGITHVFRGEEWIGSVAKHVWLFEALGWEPPVWVHVPVILGKDGKKLSKRHGDTRCLDYRAAGYCPEALANFVALIGWAPGGDLELMSMEEMCAAFDIDGLQPSPGVFDPEKLNWMNGHYIRQLSEDRLAEAVQTYLTLPDTADYWLREEHAGRPTGEALLLLSNTLRTQPELARQVLALEQPRVVTLADFGEACAFFFQEEPPMDEAAVQKWFGQPHVPELLNSLVDWLFPFAENSTPGPKAEECEAFLRTWAQDHGFEKLGPIVHPTRVALTGKTVGPGLFELMAVLGPAKMIQRVRRAREFLW